MRESERLRERLNEIDPYADDLSLDELDNVAHDAIAALERAEARVAELETCLLVVPKPNDQQWTYDGFNDEDNLAHCRWMEEEFRRTAARALGLMLRMRELAAEYEARQEATDGA